MTAIPADSSWFFRGRTGLAAILRALGIGKGDPVIVQAYTCVAVPEAVMAVGALPLYADIESSSLNMAAISLASLLPRAPKAIVVQHTFGIPADMARILTLARAADVPVIEDCCHTIDSIVAGRSVGRLGAAGFTSFESGKPVVAGIGGAAWMNDPQGTATLAKVAATMRAPGSLMELRTDLSLLAWKLLYRPRRYWTVRAANRAATRLGLGVGNYHPVGAADPPVDYGLRMGVRRERLVRRLLGVREGDANRRRDLARRYDAVLTGLERPIPPAEADPVLVRYPVFVDDKPAVLERARCADLELASWYDTPVHPLEGDRLDAVHYRPGQAPVAEAMTRRVVSLPMNVWVGERDVVRAADVLRGASG